MTGPTDRNWKDWNLFLYDGPEKGAEWLEKAGLSVKKIEDKSREVYLASGLAETQELRVEYRDGKLERYGLTTEGIMLEIDEYT